MTEIAEKSVVSKIFSIFWEPSVTFTSLHHKTRWYDVVIPLLIIAALTVAMMPYITPIAMQEQIAKIENSSRLSDAQKEATLARMQGQATPVSSYIAAPIALVVKVLIVALCIWFAGNFVLGGEARFITMFAVTAYVDLIDIISMAVKYPIIISQQTLKVYTSPALFLEESSSFVFRFLASLDIFAAWKLILLSIGLGIVNNIKSKNAFWTLLVMWLIYCVIAALLAGLIKI